jgi:hypothetical protein
MEITCQIRDLRPADTRDAELSVRAMVDVFGDDNENDATIHDFWQRKAQIVAEELQAPTRVRSEQ